MFRFNRVHANMCVCEGERKRKARVCGCGMCVSAFVCGWVGVYLCACLGLTESCVLPCCSSSRLSCSQLRRSGGLDVATELNKSCEHASTFYLSNIMLVHWRLPIVDLDCPHIVSSYLVEIRLTQVALVVLLSSCTDISTSVRPHRYLIQHAGILRTISFQECTHTLPSKHNT